MGKHLRFTAASVAALYFATNVAFAYSTESNVWSERRKAVDQSRKKDEMLMAGLPQGAASPAQILEQISQVKEQRLSPQVADRVTQDLPRALADQFSPIVKTLPFTAGTVRKIDLPAGLSPSKTIIYVQDVHLNEEAQRNIAAAVDALMKEKKIDLVALEGAFGALDMKDIQAFPERDVVAGVADYFLRQGRISGAVYAGQVFGEKAVPLIGVDERGHYDANVNAYKASAPRMKECQRKIGAGKKDLNTRKPAVFNAKLLAFDKEVEAYRAGEGSLSRYLTFLTAQNFARPGPNVDAFTKTLAIENGLNFKDVEEERGRLIQILVTKLSKDQLSVLLRQSVAYRMGQMSHGIFYQSLENLCGANGVDLSRFPSMSQYVKYVLLSDRINAEKLFEEAGALEAAGYRQLAASVEEKALVEEGKVLHLVGKILEFSLTPGEWSAYQSLTVEEKAAAGLDLASFESFYREAEARNDAMTAKLLKAMDDAHAKTAVLVTGGFHAPGITDRLTRANAAAISFVPKITKLDAKDGGAYLSVFTQEKTPLEKLFEGEKLFVSPENWTRATAAENRAALDPAAEAVRGSKPTGTARRSWEAKGRRWVTQVTARLVDAKVAVQSVRTWEGTNSWSLWHEQLKPFTVPLLVLAGVMIFGVDLGINNEVDARNFAFIAAAIVSVPFVWSVGKMHQEKDTTLYRLYESSAAAVYAVVTLGTAWGLMNALLPAGAHLVVQGILALSSVLAGQAAGTFAHEFLASLNQRYGFLSYDHSINTPPAAAVNLDDAFEQAKANLLRYTMIRRPNRFQTESTPPDIDILAGVEKSIWANEDGTPDKIGLANNLLVYVLGGSDRIFPAGTPNAEVLKARETALNAAREAFRQKVSGESDDAGRARVLSDSVDELSKGRLNARSPEVTEAVVRYVEAFFHRSRWRLEASRYLLATYAESHGRFMRRTISAHFDAIEAARWSRGIADPAELRARMEESVAILVRREARQGQIYSALRDAYINAYLESPRWSQARARWAKESPEPGEKDLSEARDKARQYLLESVAGTDKLRHLEDQHEITFSAVTMAIKFEDFLIENMKDPFDLAGQEAVRRYVAIYHASNRRKVNFEDTMVGHETSHWNVYREQLRPSFWPLLAALLVMIVGFDGNLGPEGSLWNVAGPGLVVGLAVLKVIWQKMSLRFAEAHPYQVGEKQNYLKYYKRFIGVMGVITVAVFSIGTAGLMYMAGPGLENPVLTAALALGAALVWAEGLPIVLHEIHNWGHEVVIWLLNKVLEARGRNALRPGNESHVHGDGFYKGLYKWTTDVLLPPFRYLASTGGEGDYEVPLQQPFAAEILAFVNTRRQVLETAGSWAGAVDGGMLAYELSPTGDHSNLSMLLESADIPAGLIGNYIALSKQVTVHNLSLAIPKEARNDQETILRILREQGFGNDHTSEFQVIIPAIQYPGQIGLLLVESRDHPTGAVEEIGRNLNELVILASADTDQSRTAIQRAVTNRIARQSVPTLRIVVVEMGNPSRHGLRRDLKGKFADDVDIVTATTLDQALIATDLSVDLILINTKLAHGERAKLLKALRADAPNVPIAVLDDGSNITNAEARHFRRDFGADMVVVRPAGVNDYVQSLVTKTAAIVAANRSNAAPIAERVQMDHPSTLLDYLKAKHPELLAGDHLKPGVQIWPGFTGIDPQDDVQVDDRPLELDSPVVNDMHLVIDVSPSSRRRPIILASPDTLSRLGIRNMERIMRSPGSINYGKMEMPKGWRYGAAGWDRLTEQVYHYASDMGLMAAASALCAFLAFVVFNLGGWYALISIPLIFLPTAVPIIFSSFRSGNPFVKMHPVFYMDDETFASTFNMPNKETAKKDFVAQFLVEKNGRYRPMTLKEYENYLIELDDRYARASTTGQWLFQTVVSVALFVTQSFDPVASFVIGALIGYVLGNAAGALRHQADNQRFLRNGVGAPGSAAAAARKRVEVREDAAPKAWVDELMGDVELTKVDGTKVKVNVAEFVAKAAGVLGPDIAKALNERRKRLNAKGPVEKVFGWTPWKKKFRDADGNERTFKDIVQGLIDNFHGENSELRWRLNDEDEGAPPLPDEMNPVKNPGLEITGPELIDMYMNQTNGKRDGLAGRMPDREDAATPNFRPAGVSNVIPIASWKSLKDMKDLHNGVYGDGDDPKPYLHKEKGKVYQFTAKRKDTSEVERHNGIHLTEPSVTLDGKPVPSVVFSHIVSFLNNYGALKKDDASGVYYYEPKCQTPEEALIVEKLLRMMEDLVGMKHGSIKIAMLYEEAQAGLSFPAILWVWRKRVGKVSVGRWDYWGSLEEIHAKHGAFPDARDPAVSSMTSPAMVAYQEYARDIMIMAGINSQLGLTNGSLIGGMAAAMLYPDKDPRSIYNPMALRGIRIDKLRERLMGIVFVPDPASPLPKDYRPTLNEILEFKEVGQNGLLVGRTRDGKHEIKGRLYDSIRQSWVASPDPKYVQAGARPLQAELKELQGLIDAKVTMITILKLKKDVATADSGLTVDDKKVFAGIGLLNDGGQITPAIWKNYKAPESIFTKDLWSRIYSIPKTDAKGNKLPTTVEKLQLTFYMAAQYGFQILNGNYAAAIDDYDLRLRFMNDLATNRIDVASLWAAYHNKARLTKTGWIKGPKKDPVDGVIPEEQIYEMKEGAVFDEDMLNKIFEQHARWTEAFFRDQDRGVATTIIDSYNRFGLARESAIDGVTDILGRVYGKKTTYEAAVLEIVGLLGLRQDYMDEILAEVKRGEPRFDRSKAPVIMDILKRQIMSPRYVQHPTRLLIAIAEAGDAERERHLDAIFSSSRNAVVRKVASGLLTEKDLHIHDYVYDIAILSWWERWTEKFFRWTTSRKHEIDGGGPVPGAGTVPPPTGPSTGPVSLQSRIQAQFMRSIRSDRQIIYVESEEEALEALGIFDRMGISDEKRPYIQIVDKEGDPVGLVENRSVLLDTNFRTDRRGPRELAYLTPAGEYKGFAKRDLDVDVIAPTAALEDRAYPTVVKDDPIPVVLASVLNDHNIPLHLYAVGEKVAHVIREFLRGGKKTLYPNERAYTEDAPKVEEATVKADRAKTLSQNMQPVVDRVIANLRKPSAVTLHLKGGKTLAGEVVEEAGDVIVVRKLDNFTNYSAKKGKDIVRVPKTDIVKITKDGDAPFNAHVINFGTPDLVGHAAVEEWSIEALERTDKMVGELLAALDETGSYAIFTGDHGNIESIVDPLGRPHKGHTTLPVGMAVRQPARDGRPASLMALKDQQDADLSQVMPTLLQMMGIPIPAGKNQDSLLRDTAFSLGGQGRASGSPGHAVLVIFDGLAPANPADKYSPYNKANIPNIKKLFDIQEGAGRAGRLYAHGEFVGTRKPIGETAEELADLVEKRDFTQVHLPVEGQYFNDIFTINEQETLRFLKEVEGGVHFKRYQDGEFKIHVVKSMKEVAERFRSTDFYRGKRFTIEGVKDGRLLILIDEGQIGGSEQGHTAIGAGAAKGSPESERPIRVLDRMILENGDFFDPDKNPTIAEIRKRAAAGWTFHVDAFLQEAGVHASMKHLYAWLKLLKDNGVHSDRVFLHLQTDGRDEADGMGALRLEQLMEVRRALGAGGRPYGRLVSIGPRSNHERSVNIFGRVEIEHSVNTQGRIPTHRFFDLDEPEGEFKIDEINEAVLKDFLSYYDNARLSVEKRQAVERIEELLRRIEAEGFLERHPDIAPFVQPLRDRLLRSRAEVHTVKGGMAAFLADPAIARLLKRSGNPLASVTPEKLSVAGVIVDAEHERLDNHYTFEIVYSRTLESWGMQALSKGSQWDVQRTNLAEWGMKDSTPEDPLVEGTLAVQRSAKGKSNYSFTFVVKRAFYDALPPESKGGRFIAVVGTPAVYVEVKFVPAQEPPVAIEVQSEHPTTVLDYLRERHPDLLTPDWLGLKAGVSITASYQNLDPEAVADAPVSIDDRIANGVLLFVQLPAGMDRPGSLIKAAATTRRPAAAQTAPQKQRPFRILLVDDDANKLHELERAIRSELEGQGPVQVVTAKDGEAALEIFRDHGPFDVVVTDRHMDKMGGDVLAREIRKINTDQPVIVLSGGLEGMERALLRQALDDLKGPSIGLFHKENEQPQWLAFLRKEFDRVVRAVRDNPKAVIGYLVLGFTLKAVQVLWGDAAAASLGLAFAALAVLMPERRNEYVVPFSALSKEDVLFAGGKCANLGFLRKNDLPVPDGYALTAPGYQKIISANPAVVRRMTEILQNTDTSDEKQLVAAEKELKEIIDRCEIPDEILGLIDSEFVELAVRLGVDPDKLRSANRSSASVEDRELTMAMRRALGKELSSGSSAGQQGTELNIRRAMLKAAIKKNLGTLFNLNAISYRDNQGLRDFLIDLSKNERVDLRRRLLAYKNPADPNEALIQEVGQMLTFKKVVSRARLKIAVQAVAPELLGRLEDAYNPYVDASVLSLPLAIQEMVKSKVSFTMFSYDETPEWTAYSFQKKWSEMKPAEGRIFVLETLYGLGEAVVQGLATPDRYMIHVFKDADGNDQYRIIEKIFGQKNVEVLDLELIVNELGLDLDQFEALAAVLKQRLEGREGPGMEDSEAAILEEVVKILGATGTLEGILGLLADELRKPAPEVTDTFIENPGERAGSGASGLRITNFQLRRLVDALREREENVDSYTVRTVVDQARRERFALSDEKILEIVKMGKKATDIYDNVRDMEGAIDDKDQVRLLQSRAITVQTEVDRIGFHQDSRSVFKESDLTRLEDEGRFLLSGFESQNVGVGELYFVDRTIPRDELHAQIRAKVKQMDDLGKKLILVAESTKPDDEPILKLKGIGGIIAFTGGKTSHAAIIARELGVPSVVGIDSFLAGINASDPDKYRWLLEVLRTGGAAEGSGVSVALDGNTGKVYFLKAPAGFPRGPTDAKGEARYKNTDWVPEIEKRNIVTDLRNLPKLHFTKPGFIVASANVMRQNSMIATDNSWGGVKLKRAEFDLSSIGHPLAFLDYDAWNKVEAWKRSGSPAGDRPTESEMMGWEYISKMSGANRTAFLREMAARIMGYPSATAFFKSKYSNAATSMCAATSLDREVLLRHNDFKQKELADIPFGRFYAIHEDVYMEGFRGAAYLLHPRNRPMLIMELEAAAQAYRDGYTNLGVFIPFLRTPKELKTYLDLCALYLPKEMARGMMVETVANIIWAPEFAEVLAQHALETGAPVFGSVGTNDLTQLTLRAGREEPLVKDLNREDDETVLASIEYFAAQIEEAVKDHGEKFQAKWGHAMEFSLSLCGEGPTNLAGTNPEAAIRMITPLTGTGVSPMKYFQLRRLMAANELKIAQIDPASLRRIKTVSGVTAQSPNRKAGAGSRHFFTVRTFKDLREAHPGAFLYLAPDFKVDLRDAEAVEELDNLEVEDVLQALDIVIRDSIDSVLVADAKAIRKDLPLDDLLALENIVVSDAFKLRFAKFLVHSALDQAGAVIRQERLGGKELDIIIISKSGKRKVFSPYQDASGPSRGVPFALLNLERGGDSLAKLDKQMVTIDFAKGRFWRGEAKFEKTTIKRPPLLKRVERVHAPEHEKAVFVSANDVYRDLGQHPVHAASQANTGARAVRNKVQEKVLAAAENAQPGQVLVYQTSDLNTLDLSRIPGAEGNVRKEENPPLGLGGFSRYFFNGGHTPERNLLLWEMQALKSLVYSLRSKGISLVIETTDVRELRHLREFLSIAREAGIDIGKDLQLSLRVDTPNNIYRIRDYLKEIPFSYIHFDEKRLRHNIFNADQDNDHLLKDREEEDERLPVVYNIVRQAAYDAEIKELVTSLPPAKGPAVPPQLADWARRMAGGLVKRWRTEAPPQGEPIEPIRTRAIEFYEEVSKEVSTPEEGERKNAFVVSHGYVLSQMLAHALGRPVNADIGNLFPTAVPVVLSFEKGKITSIEVLVRSAEPLTPTEAGDMLVLRMFLGNEIPVVVVEGEAEAAKLAKDGKGHMVFMRHGAAIPEEMLKTGSPQLGAQTNIGITDQGARAAQAVGRLLTARFGFDFDFDEVYSSELKRAIQTVHEVDENMPTGRSMTVRQDARLNERKFGLTSGFVPDELPGVVEGLLLRIARGDPAFGRNEDLIAVDKRLGREWFNWVLSHKEDVERHFPLDVAPLMLPGVEWLVTSLFGWIPTKYISWRHRLMAGFTALIELPLKVFAPFWWLGLHRADTPEERQALFGNAVTLFKATALAFVVMTLLSLGVNALDLGVYAGWEVVAVGTVVTNLAVHTDIDEKALRQMRAEEKDRAAKTAPLILEALQPGSSNEQMERALQALMATNPVDFEGLRGILALGPARENEFVHALADELTLYRGDELRGGWTPERSAALLNALAVVSQAGTADLTNVDKAVDYISGEKDLAQAKGLMSRMAEGAQTLLIATSDEGARLAAELARTDSRFSVSRGIARGSIDAQDAVRRYEEWMAGRKLTAGKTLLAFSGSAKIDKASFRNLKDSPFSGVLDLDLLIPMMMDIQAYFRLLDMRKKLVDQMA